MWTGIFWAKLKEKKSCHLDGTILCPKSWIYHSALMGVLPMPRGINAPPYNHECCFKNFLAYKYGVYKRESSDFSDLIPQLKHVLLEIGDL